MSVWSWIYGILNWVSPASCCGMPTIPMTNEMMIWYDVKSTYLQLASCRRRRIICITSRHQSAPSLQTPPQRNNNSNNKRSNIITNSPTTEQTASANNWFAIFQLRGTSVFLEKYAYQTQELVEIVYAGVCTSAHLYNGNGGSQQDDLILVGASEQLYWVPISRSFLFSCWEKDIPLFPPPSAKRISCCQWLIGNGNIIVCARMQGESQTW